MLGVGMLGVGMLEAGTVEGDDLPGSGWRPDGVTFVLLVKSIYRCMTRMACRAASASACVGKSRGKSPDVSEAMREATSRTTLGDFNNSGFVIKGLRRRSSGFSMFSARAALIRSSDNGRDRGLVWVCGCG